MKKCDAAVYGDDVMGFVRPEEECGLPAVRSFVVAYDNPQTGEDARYRTIRCEAHCEMFWEDSSGMGEQVLSDIPINP